MIVTFIFQAFGTSDEYLLPSHVCPDYCALTVVANGTDLVILKIIALTQI